MFFCCQQGEAVLEEEGIAGDEKLRLLILLFVPNRIVIPTGAHRSGGTCCSSSAVSNLNGSATLPFVIPTGA
jgi:hypothetical protein